MEAAANFIPLDLANVTFLFIVGFVGGLVSGFIGSGGAFVLTPAMMSMGVPGIVAVASNICHKFPKALVGAIKRAKYGQVDVKLGVIMGLSAEAGVLYGAHVQEGIKRAFGDAGSNLYVSVAFVIVLGIVGIYVLRDAVKVYRSGKTDEAEKVSTLARRVQAIRIPGTMMYFKSLNAEVSVLFTIPLGFATGMLAATIAVGGFIGVPGMHYVLGAPSIMASASELVIAFVMGLGGTIKYAWSGLVDIRLAMIILAGSLFGIQLGAIGTTYVKPFMIKLVMGVIMVMVLLSRGFVIPVYLAELDLIAPLAPLTVTILNNTSFTIMVLALGAGAFIIVGALLRGMRAHRAELAATPTAAPAPATVASPASPQLSPTGRFERLLVCTDGSEYSTGAVREAIRMAKKCGGRLTAISVVATGAEQESMGEQLLKKELDAAQTYVDQVCSQASAAGVACEIKVVQGAHTYQEIVSAAESMKADVIVMGRGSRKGMARLVLADETVRVIGHAQCSVMVVPRAAEITGRHISVASDGSRYGDAAAVTAGNLAKLCGSPLTVVSVTQPSHSEERKREAQSVVQRVTAFYDKEGLKARGELISGRPDEAIIEIAKRDNSDLIVVGSHGRTGLDRILLGSIAERILNQSPVAVLVVKGA